MQFRKCNFKHKVKRLQLLQKRVYQKFYVREIAAVNLSKIYFLKNAKETCKPNNRDLKSRLNNIRRHKGQNSTETRCCGFLDLESRCSGFSVLESQCRGFSSSEKMPRNHDFVAQLSLFLDVVVFQSPNLDIASFWSWNLDVVAFLV